MTDLKNILLILMLHVSCGQTARDYETKDWFEANLSISSKKIYKTEVWTLKVNGREIYKLKGDTVNYAVYKLFRVPETMNEIRIISTSNGRIVFEKVIEGVSSAKKYQVRIGEPYPQEFTQRPLNYQSRWLQLPIDKIKRDVVIISDTSTNNIIL